MLHVSVRCAVMVVIFNDGTRPEGRHFRSVLKVSDSSTSNRRSRLDARRSTRGLFKVLRRRAKKVNTTLRKDSAAELCKIYFSYTESTYILHGEAGFCYLGGARVLFDYNIVSGRGASTVTGSQSASLRHLSFNVCRG
jgi:hypothetical protein